MAAISQARLLASAGIEKGCFFARGRLPASALMRGNYRGLPLQADWGGSAIRAAIT